MPCNRRRQTSPCPPRPRRGAFSLVELLVVIGIIAVLVGILIPVVGRMRKEAFKVDTAALINTLRSATESYHANFKAYPGPFSDDDVYGHVNWNRGNRVGIAKNIQHSGQNYVTGTEQLFLSLCGGLRLEQSSQDPEFFVMSNGALPTGPSNLNTRNPKVMNAFLTDAGKYLPHEWYKLPNFRDAAGNVASDTNVPEFLDRYPEPLPILYLRARRGAPGIVTDNDKTPYQYDLRQVSGYTSMPAVGAKHGLQKVGDASSSIKKSMDDNKGGADALPYFKIPGASLPSSFSATNQIGAAPRSQDTYIMISAGPDRIYGTIDDITSFGPVE
jgi:prepilin-type N-terminal cleavage/methylation domain-containing protein